MSAQQQLFETEKFEKYDSLTREELIELHKIDRKMIEQLRQECLRVLAKYGEQADRMMLIEDQRVWLRHVLFGKSSEKEPKPEESQDTSAPNPKPKKPRVQRLSERYSDVPVIERYVGLEDLPDCGCCGKEMSDSGMTEDSETLTMIPKQFFVVRQKRHKYRCDHCHGALVTAPCPPRIKAGSSYSDAMILDVALSKYCDLIPINRYVRMAERSGVSDLPPQSLIETTHHLADFFKPVYELLRTEIRAEKVLHADETPHRMLEGDDKTNWQLWGFSSKKTSYFEARDTRSGDVASEFLKNSACEFLMSDVYSGYGKAIREANLYRHEKGQKTIQGIYCNAHARRRFKEAEQKFPTDARFFIDHYKKIYHLESLAPDKPPEEFLQLRQQMKPSFDAMRYRAIELAPAYPEKSTMGRALSYFLGNFDPLTSFVGNIYLPIDNNPQERLLRNPVIGRKTWYGTHSVRGADTMCVLFSIVESCKLNKINPRTFFQKLAQDLLDGNPPYTPASTLTQ